MHIFSKDYMQFLMAHIKPICKPTSGGRWLNCRCFYCPDSKNPNHAHMYISIPQSENDVSVYYCQKCKAVGLVTPQKLIEWNVYDSNLATDLNKWNHRVMKLPQNIKYKGDVVYKLRNDYIEDDELSAYKLQYINDRLGSGLSFNDCLKLKIVLNISDIFKRNNIQYTRDPRIIDQLDRGFVGFISKDNAFLNLRNIGIVKNLHESINTRYVNYNLMGKYDNAFRFYTIPATIDLLDPRPTRLHIAEGAFDILSIYLNLHRNTDRDIATAVGGSGYKGVIRYFISILKTPNLEIHLYPDNDQSRYVITDIANYIYPFRYKFFVHRNNYPGEKDFGVPINRISEIIERVL